MFAERESGRRDNPTQGDWAGTKARGLSDFGEGEKTGLGQKGGRGGGCKRSGKNILDDNAFIEHLLCT